MSSRPASLAVSLVIWWRSVAPGVGVTMDEMREAFDDPDPQVIRNALTQLRKGLVRDPAKRGRFMRRVPIVFNREDGKYYDMSKVTGDAVSAQIPGNILAERLADLLTRASTIDSSMGEDGLVRSAEDLLTDTDTRKLIAQLPLPQIFAAAKLMLNTAEARQLLEVQESKRLLAGTGAGTVLPSSADLTSHMEDPEEA